MASVIEELERKRAAEGAEPAGNSATGDYTAPETEVSEGPVQTGTVSEADRGKLLKDVGTGGGFQDYLRNYLAAANKKFEPQRGPSPGLRPVIRAG